MITASEFLKWAQIFHLVGSGGGGGGPFLTIAGNLSDLNNVQTALANIGQGSGQTIVLADVDFVGGVYNLPNPCPNDITILCTTSGNKLRLPVANVAESFSLDQGPYISIPPGFESIELDYASGGFLITLDSPSATKMRVTAKSTSDGVWSFRDIVEQVNNDSGDVTIDLQSVYLAGIAALISLSASRPIIFEDISSGSIVKINDSTTNDSVLFEIDSTTSASIPYPAMTAAQQALIPTMTAPMSVYITDTKSIEYWDGTSWQTVLTIGHLIAGGNIVLTPNGDGTVTISATGGGSGGSSNFGGYSVLGNPGTTPISAPNTLIPISVGSIAFTNVVASGFTPQLLNIGGVTGPVFTYTGSATQYFEVNINMNIRGSIASTERYEFRISIYTAATTITTTVYASTIQLNDNSTLLPQSLSGIVQLNAGDSVFIQAQNLTGSDPLTVQYMTATIVNVNASTMIDLQQAYNNGTGIINEGSNKPVVLTNNSGTGDNSTLFDLVSTTLGARPWSTMTDTQRNAIGTPATALALWSSTSNRLNLYDGSSYQQVAYLSDLANPGFLNVTTPTQVMVPNFTYLANNSTLITFTLPATAPVGSIIRIIGFGSGGWTLHQIASGQQIFYSSFSTTLGTSGNLGPNIPTDGITLQCIVADNVWSAIASVGDFILN